jgi:hypothetical protein
MDNWFEPVAIITTMQPLLVVWLLAISFFVTLAVVAMLSRGRKWFELACMFLVCFVVLSAVGVGVSYWLLEVTVFQVEVISAS